MAPPLAAEASPAPGLSRYSGCSTVAVALAPPAGDRAKMRVIDLRNPCWQ
jgi:hypothetical protein